MTTWIIPAIFSAIFAALVAILAKLGLQNINSTLATTLRSIIMAFFLYIVSATTGQFKGINALDKKALFYIMLSGIAGALSWLCYFLALKLGPAVGVSAIDRSSVIFVLIFAFLFLGEPLTLKAIIGILFIFSGVLIISWK